MRKWIIAPVGLALLGLAGCGETKGQRAATGAGGGAVAGAVVGGPVGALAGAGIGAAGGAYREELQQRSDDAVDRAARAEERPEQTRSGDGSGRVAAARQRSDGAGDTARNRPWTGNGAAAADDLTNEQVREAQTALRDLGFYDGRIDGLYGRRTIAAVGEFQAQQQDLPRTLALDDATRERLRNRQARAGDTERPQDAGRLPENGGTPVPEPSRVPEPAQEQPSDPQQQGRLSGQQQ